MYMECLVVRLYDDHAGILGASEGCADTPLNRLSGVNRDYIVHNKGSRDIPRLAILPSSRRPL